MRRLGVVLMICNLALTCAIAHAAELANETMPESFVYVDDFIPGIEEELRYFTDKNFVGRPVDGYVKSRCILTRKAAEALRQIQDELNRFGFGLKIYDGYRPQRAVDDFVRWGKELENTKTKKEFYPNVEKKDLFKEGYIAEKSSHSKGSTVDLTIVFLDSAPPGKELDMGTGFDFFGPESWPDNASMTPSQRANRLLLRVLMEKHGFQPYPKEWWHFTLRNEPFPNTYFNFPVQ